MGEAGLTLVGYMGRDKGRYKGPMTCHLYEVDPGKPFMYLDSREVDHFVALRGAAGEELFCRA